MFGIDLDESVVVQQREVLEKALSTNPKTVQALRKLVRKVINEAREGVMQSTKNTVPNDPRGTVNSIRRSVYKKILGGNLNILRYSRIVDAPNNYEPPRKLEQNPRQRGGNRVPRGARTNTIMHYGPRDRGWILCILNSGTYNGVRMAGSRGGRLGGKRGVIASRNFFGPSSRRALTKAADNLANLIDTELEQMLNKKK